MSYRQMGDMTSLGPEGVLCSFSQSLYYVVVDDDRSLLYRLCSPLSGRLTARACDSAWVNSFFAFLNIHRSGVLSALAWLVPHETAAVYSIQPRTMSLRAKPRKVHASLAVTCHLHFCQNDRKPVRANAVTRRVEQIPKKESAPKVDPGEDNCPAAPAGFEPTTFQSRVRSSNHWAILAPRSIKTLRVNYRYQLIPTQGWCEDVNMEHTDTFSHSYEHRTYIRLRASLSGTFFLKDVVNQCLEFGHT